jgi:hypothetical protein
MKKFITDLFHASFDVLQNDQVRTAPNRRFNVINDDNEQEDDIMASKALQVSLTLRGSGSTSDSSDTDYNTEISNDSEPDVPVERQPSRRQSYHGPTSSGTNKASTEINDIESVPVERRRQSYHEPTSSAANKASTEINDSEPGPVERRRQSYQGPTSSADNKAAPDLRRKGRFSSRPRQSSTTRTPRPRPRPSADRRKSSGARRPSETVNLNSTELDNGSEKTLVKSKASKQGDNKESRSGSSDRPRGRRASEILNPNAVSSDVAMERPARSKSSDTPRTSRRSSEIILTANDNTMGSSSQSSEGTRKRSSSSDGTKDRGRGSNCFEKKSTSGGRDRDSYVSRSTRGNRPKSPGGTMRATSPITRPKTSSVRNRRYVSAVALSKFRDSFSMLASWDDLSDGDASSPSKSGEKLRPSASSSDAAGEARPEDQQPGEVRSRRRASCVGPRDRISQSSHGRSRCSRGGRLSKSSHDKPSRVRRDRLSQYTRANLKALDPPEDDTDEFAEDVPIRIEETTLLTCHRPPPEQADDTQEQAHTPSPVKPDHLDQAALLHELLSQSAPAYMDAPLDPPSVASSSILLESQSQYTRYTSNLQALLSRPTSITSSTVLDAPSLDPPSICLPLVSHAKPVPQMKPAEKKNMLANLLKNPIPVTNFTLMDDPSTAPPSVCAIPLPPKTNSKKTQAKSGTGLGELLNKKPITTFMVDAPSLADPPSVCFHANPDAPKKKKSLCVKDGRRMSGTQADFSASADLSKQPNPWPSSWGAFSLAAESHKTGNKNSAATVVAEKISSLDPPSISLPQQIKPGQENNAPANLLKKPRPVTAFPLMDAPSLALPPKTDSKKTQAKSGKSGTGLGELLSKKPITTFMVDAPSLADPPSVCFHANPDAKKKKKSLGVKDGRRMSGTQADFSANLDRSNESDPWAISWGGLASDPHCRQ